MAKDQDWTPERLLQVWSCRQFGSMSDPSRVSGTGGKATTDDEQQASFYVEQTPGFNNCREVLSWVYCDFKDVRKFRPTEPGKILTVDQAFRKGWGFIEFGTPETLIGQTVLNHFMNALVERCRTQPFKVIRSIEEEQAA